MKHVFLLLLSLSMYLGVQAQCQSGNCTNGVGKIKYPSGVVYEGDFKNGQRNGKGTCYMTNGNKYVGFWSENFPDGRGRMYKPDGSFEDGIWERGKLVEVISENPDMVQKGFIVEGENLGTKEDSSRVAKVNDLPAGDDTEEDTEIASSDDPNCLIGNCLEGIGVYSYENGDVYEGEFHLGMRDGEGTYRYSNGDRYEGDFVRHQFHGEGSIVYKDGKKLTGYWNEGAWLGEIRGDDETKVAETSDANPDDMRVWAVIAGVTEYKTMSKLNYTDDDAQMLADFLQSPEGGGVPSNQIHLLLNEEATFRNITGAMFELYEQAGPNDLIIFYFSGHGLEGSFLPSDYDGKRNMLPHGMVNTLLLDSPAKYKLCLADACHSGSLLSGIASRGATADQTIKKYYNAFKDIRGGVSLIMSSKSEEYSLESNGLKQGLFSHFIIRGLKGEADADKSSVVTVTELYQYVSKNVSEFSAGFQNPVISGSYDPQMPVSVTE